MYLVYRNKRFLKSADKRFLGAVDRLAEKIEQDQSIGSWDNFLPSPVVRKKLGTWRLLAEKRVVDDSIVISFLELVPRGNAEYDVKFLSDPPGYCAKLYPSEAEVLEYIKIRKAKPIVHLPSPDELEYTYLYDNVARIDASDGVVFESEDWVERMGRQDVLDLSSRFYDLLEKTFDTNNSDRNIARSERSNARLMYRYFPERKHLFLVAPLPTDDPTTERALRMKYADVLKAESAKQDADAIARLSRRSYPALILADEPAWMAIERNREGNLALSPEEAAILESVRNPANSSKVFPLFINGRPGSGKSTILQYLFAEHLYLHLCRFDVNHLDHPPLYLTYSEKLLERAQAAVRSIMQCNSNLAFEGKLDMDAPWVAQEIKRSFGVFQTFLVSLLPPSQHSDFDVANRIGFPLFRQRWEASRKNDPDFEVRKLSPELIWHVIRTYVKGMSDETTGYLDADAYSELPDKQRTVPLDMYTRIWERVWDNWYRPMCQEENLWDDQDLARTVLRLEATEVSRHPVVFCDEAQDFTKIELELIQRLNLFSRRTLRPEDLRRIPFAFAGDPFQTLNPTGFEWGSVQAGFHEKIIQELDRYANAKLEFNYQELSYNYRSTNNVVRFCNMLQLLRGILFDVPGLKPQQPYFEEQDSPMAVYYDVGDRFCQQKLEEQAEQIIVLPCQEGEELEYVENDDYLKPILRGGQEVRNFLSAISVKGLEFSRVVLYRFGDTCVNSYPKLLMPLETGAPHSESHELTLPLQYFMNRLYVAASRAKRRLIIVDTKEGIDGFWKNKRVRNFAELLDRYTDGSSWSVDDLAFVQPGLEASWSADRDDPVELAKALAEAGRSERDPYKLRLASANFRRAGEELQALACDAVRHEIDGNYYQAGQTYVQLGRAQDALRCLWKSRSYLEIQNNPLFANTIQQRAADFMASTKSALVCERFLQFLHEELEGPERMALVADAVWPEIGDQLVLSLAAFEPDADGALLWPSIHSKIYAMTAAGLTLRESRELGEIAYRAGDYRSATRIWERNDPSITRESRFKIAKAHSASYPENVELYVLAGLPEQAITAWEQSRAKRAAPHIIDTLATTYLDLGRADEVIRFLRDHPQAPTLEMTFDRLTASGRGDHSRQVGEQLLSVLTERNEWKKALTWLHRESIGQPIRDGLNATFVRAVARGFIGQPPAVQTEVAQYLRSLFLDKPWTGLVEVQTAGAAIERAERIIDALAFYEAVWRTKSIPATADEKRFARQRWLKRKYRQAERSKEAGREDDAAKQRSEADKLARKWHVTLDDLPDYPEVQPGVSRKREDIASKTESRLTPRKRNQIRTLLDAGTPAEDIAEEWDLDLADVLAVGADASDTAPHIS